MALTAWDAEEERTVCLVMPGVTQRIWDRARGAVSRGESRVE